MFLIFWRCREGGWNFLLAKIHLILSQELRRILKDKRNNETPNFEIRARYTRLLFTTSSVSFSWPSTWVHAQLDTRLILTLLDLHDMFKHLLNTHPKRSTDPVQIFTKISHFKSPIYIQRRLKDWNKPTNATWACPYTQCCKMRLEGVVEWQ